MDAQKDNKDVVIRLRVTTQFRDAFQQLCKQKAINSSELLRQLISQWMYEQQNTSINHQRTLDIK